MTREDICPEMLYAAPVYVYVYVHACMVEQVCLCACVCVRSKGFTVCDLMFTIAKDAAETGTETQGARARE